MADELFAGMGEYVLGKAPSVLTSLGLGSCVGCVIYDPEKKMGGLAHIMLPFSKEIGNAHEQNMNKFADIAVPAMFADLRKQGCSPDRMVVKIAGGAHMFLEMIDANTMDIGRRNIDSVKEQISKLGLRISGSEVGGGVGRTIHFDTETGKLSVKSKDGLKQI